MTATPISWLFESELCWHQVLCSYYRDLNDRVTAWLEGPTSCGLTLHYIRERMLA